VQIVGAGVDLGLELARDLVSSAAAPAAVVEVDGDSGVVVEVRVYTREEIAGLVIIAIVGGAVVVLVAAFVYVATVRRTPRWIRYVNLSSKNGSRILQCAAANLNF